MPVVVGSVRRFTRENQQQFAELSGDFNPLHVDPLMARRTLAGSPAVHGVNAVLWSLESWVTTLQTAVSLRSLDARFLRPIPVDADIELSVTCESDDHATMSLAVGPTIVATIDVVVEAGMVNAAESDTVADAVPQREPPREIDARQIEGMNGSVPLILSREISRRLFPVLAEYLPRTQLAGLIATTRLVGVHCPGLHSLYSELHVAVATQTDMPLVDYTVSRFDGRFGLATIAIEGAGLRGTIKAFLRPAPRRQPSYADIRPQVAATEFSDQRALVIGGSRGLGEVVAKTLAAGGADVVITYHRGQEEAQNIVSEITSNGGRVSCVALDVTLPVQENGRATDAWSPTHLYYMATPFIFCGQRGEFQSEIYSRFCSYYVTGFAAAFNRARTPALHAVFYPSSVAMDELPPDMGEYVAAKSAGETLCAVLEKANPTVRIVRPRLPRLATDQTMSLVPVRNVEPLPVILTILRQMAMGDA